MYIYNTGLFNYCHIESHYFYTFSEMKRRVTQHSYGTRRNVSRKLWGPPENAVMLNFVKLDTLAEFVKNFELQVLPDRSVLDLYHESILRCSEEGHVDEHDITLPRRLRKSFGDVQPSDHLQSTRYSRCASIAVRNDLASAPTEAFFEHLMSVLKPGDQIIQLFQNAIQVFVDAYILCRCILAY